MTGVLVAFPYPVRSRVFASLLARLSNWGAVHAAPLSFFTITCAID